MIPPIIATVILAIPLALAVTEDVGSILPQLQRLISVNDPLVEGSSPSGTTIHIEIMASCR